jgi:PBSX family phage portal protein
MSEDPVSALIGKGSVIEPPFDMLTLTMLPEHSTEMNQCIDTMETNIDGFGHRYVPRVKLDDDQAQVPPEVRKAVHVERVRLENFFQYACGDDSFTRFRRKLRRDMEATGNCYFEVIRDATQKIQGFRHIPSHHMTIGKLEDESVLTQRPILELQEDYSVKVVDVPEWRRFRMYVQARSVTMRNLSAYTGKVRWFKELGDVRVYNCDTGEEAKGNLPPEKRANEIVHMTNYSARSPYGLPRYIGNLLSIFGDRAAEEINFITFRNNNIPSMVVCVSNGQLTEGTIQRIESFVESQIQGSDNYSKFLILEAETDLEGEDGGQVKLDIKPLVKEQHKDALFQNYSTNNQDKIRRAWRLPPIFVGRADEYTRATAESSRRLADEQIFAPERDEFDEMVNRILFPYMGVVYHKFKSNSPNTTDNAELVKILAGSEKTGGMTPRIARRIFEEVLNRDLPPFPAGFPADVPFSLTMAEAVKNLAQPNEPGQQLTALKMLGQLTGETSDEEPTVIEAECRNCGNKQLIHAIEKSEGDPLTNYLVSLNKRIEARWQSALKTQDDMDDVVEE